MSAITSKPATTTTDKQPKGKAKPKAKGNSKAAFPSKAGNGKGPGVVGSIIEFLQAASAKKPITKKDILAKLLARFPDRPEAGMKTTINCQVPNRLKERDLDVQKNDNGFWIA